MKRHPFLAFVAILIMTVLACVQPGAPAAPAMDPNAMNTSIAQTIAARQTEAVLNNPPTATFTPAPETPTSTAEPTLSLTPEFTATSEIPMISVSQDTNCRVGPGSIYPRVGIFLVGDTTEILGREAKGEYWYIRNPDVADNGVEFCWVWGEYATTSGNLLPLLFLSPPPPAALTFDLTFEKMETCNNWWADFKLVNKGGELFRSVSITLTDTDTSPVTIVAQSANGFTNNDGCGSPVVRETLVSGAAVTISSPQFAYNPTGHKLIAKISVCTENDQQGTCIMQEINFTP